MKSLTVDNGCVIFSSALQTLFSAILCLINTGMNHLRSPEDAAAFAALPNVLKQGGVLPDGSAFKFEMQHSGPSGGFVQNGTRLATNTNAASLGTVTRQEEEVKGF